MKSSFAKETDLCAAFIAALPPEWTAYPETAGWDILLAHETGTQVGVSAKLRLNADVLNQAAESRFGYFHYQDYPGPDYRAVLVPSGQTTGLSTLAVYCGVTVIEMSVPPYSFRRTFEPGLPHDKMVRFDDYWHEMMPARRHPLPEYVPDVPAGASAPVQLTDWKIRALKLCVLSESTGYVTRQDFKRLKIDIRRWLGNWMTPVPEGFVVKSDVVAGFRTQHPRVWEEIAREPKKWQRIAA